MSSPQQSKRVAPQTDREDANGAKRSRQLVRVDAEVKQEQCCGKGGEEAGQGGQGEGALVPVVQAMEEPHININMRMPEALLRCHACALALKPPVFKCLEGHDLCGACRGNHVQVCTGASTYIPCTKLDEIVRRIKVPCAYEEYGCTSRIVYYKLPDHHRSCRFEPCFCPDPACGYFTSPAKMTDHFSSHHGWPVINIGYAMPKKLDVPTPGQDKLVLVGNADGSVFVVSPYPAVFGADMAVSLVCIRACGDAAAGAPQYTFKLWTEHARTSLILASDVASSQMAGGFPSIGQVPYLPLELLLHGKSGGPSAVMVRIDKVGVSATRSRSPAASAPSTTPLRMLQ